MPGNWCDPGKLGRQGEWVFQHSKSDKASKLRKSCKLGRADELSELSTLGKLVKH